MSLALSPLKLGMSGKRSAHPSPARPHNTSKSQPRYFIIGDHVELQSPEDIIPWDFQAISGAFQAGVRAVLTRISSTIFCVCGCRKINEENSSVDIVNDEGSLAITMFPDDCCIFKLDEKIGKLYPLDEYSVFGFNLGDVISDPYQRYRILADGWNTTCELSQVRGRERQLPNEIDDDAGVITRLCIASINWPDHPDRYIPPLSQQYANLHDDSKVFQVFSRARQTSVYVGGWVKNPQVGQLVAKFSAIGCYILAVIVYVGENYVILRDSVDYAARRSRYRWGPLPENSMYYVDCILKIRRLDWWVTAGCKCVPLLPHRFDKDWGQWPRSELLHLSDGT
jgi:hypothetical protein